ncbi:MAG TPA: flavin reductase [Terriglobales bacterium]|nr:flavin reductase [Terriglobales bacterium]
MSSQDSGQLIQLPTDRPLWDRIFTVAPLVIVGSKDVNGAYDLAPKHMVMPLGLGHYFCFVCSPRHTTYHNVRRHGVFTVSYPRIGEVVYSSLAAAPRSDDESKPSLLALPTFAATRVDGVLVEGCYLFLECDLHSIIDDFDGYSLIIGKVVAAAAHDDALRKREIDESDQIFQFPLLAYLHPNRLAEIRQSTAFPLPEGFSR